MNVSLQNTQVLLHVVPHQAMFNTVLIFFFFPLPWEMHGFFQKMKAKRRHKSESLMHKEQSFTLPWCCTITLFFSNTRQVSQAFKRVQQVMPGTETGDRPWSFLALKGGKYKKHLFHRAQVFSTKASKHPQPVCPFKTANC